MRRMTSYLRYHRRGVAWSALAVLVFFGGGLAIGRAMSGTGSSTNAAAQATTTTSPATTAPSGLHSVDSKGTKAVKGTITQLGSTSWTMTTASNRTVTVDFNGTTVFGSRIAPSKAAVGDHIAVRGSRSGRTITATHIALISAAS